MVHKVSLVLYIKYQWSGTIEVASSLTVNYKSANTNDITYGRWITRAIQRAKAYL